MEVSDITTSTHSFYIANHKQYGFETALPGLSNGLGV
jgi:hypothetical protein